MSLLLEHFPLFLMLAGGLILWTASVWFEARHLKAAWYFLVGPETEEEHNGRREVLLERINVALGAARLGRLMALVLIPPCVLLLVYTDRFLPALSLEGALGGVWGLLIVAAAVALLLAAIQGFCMRRFYDSPREKNGSHWLTDDALPVPALAEAASILWDWLFRAGEAVLRWCGLERQMAYLFEHEDQLLMAVGDEEVEAFAARTKDEIVHHAPGERSERDMIRAIQRLDETLVREVMRPLNKVTPVNLSHITPMRFLALARRTGYTRFPCYEDQVTNLIGYLNIHDLLDSTELPSSLRPLVHEAPFIPEVARLDVVLQEMLRKKSQIAICFDEFGGCSGLLSREDIIEEITGEIMDEYDRVEEAKWEARRGDFLVDASIDLDDLSESIGLNLEKRNCDTLAGYIYHRLNRVPRRGEILEERGWILEIVHMDKHRIQKVRIVPPPPADGGEGGEP